MEKEKSLTAEEKRIVKALLNNGKTNQDVHAIINYERGTTVNFGRISGVKKIRILFQLPQRKSNFS